MNHQPRIRLYLVPLFSGLLLGGCTTVEKETRDLSLQAAASAYQTALRWGYLDTAFGYLAPELRRGKGLPADFKDLRLTDYEILQPAMLTGEGEGTQIVGYEYLHDDRQVVKRLIDHQVWRYDPKIKNWWLVSGLPKFE
jgi:outer membrane biogenesis lipoprotein LolB